jgi:hypothetical protein
MTVATSDTGSAGTTSPTLRYQHLPEPLDLGEAAAVVERAEIDAALGHVVAQRHRPPEADAGVTVAIELAAQAQRDVVRQIAEQHLRAELKRGFSPSGVVSAATCTRSSITRS